MLISQAPAPRVISYAYLHRNRFILQHAAYDTWVVMLLVCGKFTCRMGGRQYVASAGDVFFFPPHVPFDRKVIEPLQMHYIELAWTQSTPMEPTVPLPEGKLLLTDRRRETSTISLLGRLRFSDAEEQKPWAEHYLRDLWFQYLAEQLPVSQDNSDLFDDPLMRSAAAYLRSHFSEPLCLGDVASLLHIQPAALTKRFFRAAGVTPSAYLQALRMTYADKLLIESDLPVHDIAEQCGYESPFYFSRRFKRHTGLTPSQYRRKHRI